MRTRVQGGDEEEKDSEPLRNFCTLLLRNWFQSRNGSKTFVAFVASLSLFSGRFTRFRLCSFCTIDVSFYVVEYTMFDRFGLGSGFHVPKILYARMSFLLWLSRQTSQS